MILTTIEEFREVFPTMAKGIEFQNVETFVGTAETYLKEELLGDALYEFVDENKGELAHVKIVEKCKIIIALQATHEAIPFWDLVMDGNGFAIVRTTQLAPASPERVKALREAVVARRDAVIDYLIDYLEATDTYQIEWKGSPVYEDLSSCLFRTARELQRYSNNTWSRSAFLQLKPKLIADTKLMIEPLVSEAYIEELIEKQRDNDVSADDKKVLNLCKYALGALANDNKPAAELLLGQLVTYLDKNLTKYTTYAASAEYTTRNTAGYTNTDSQIFVSPC